MSKHEKHYWRAARIALQTASQQDRKELERHKQFKWYEHLMDCREVNKFVDEEHGVIPTPARKSAPRKILESTAISCLRSGGCIVYDSVSKNRIVHLNGMEIGVITHGILQSICKTGNVRKHHIVGTNCDRYEWSVTA